LNGFSKRRNIWKGAVKMDAGEMKARLEAEKLAKARAATERMSQAGSNSAKIAKEKEEAAKKVQAEILAKRSAAQASVRASAVSSGSRLGSASMAASMSVMGKQALAAQVQKNIAEYTVKKGDTLSQIAKNYYGSATQPYWKLIQDANKDIIKNANLIYPGQVFKIPELPEAMKKK
jgi:nucleoid-associated protein YgaU